MTENNEIPAIFQTQTHQTHQNDTPSALSAVEQQAAAVISDLSAKYPAWAMADVLKLKRFFNDAHSISGAFRTQLIKDDLYRVSHDIKGQGGTFGYPLMTEMAASLCEFIKSKEEFATDEMAVIKTRIDDLEFILTQKLSGNGGELGAQLRAKLTQELSSK